MGAENLQPVNPLLDKRFVSAFVDGVIKTTSLMASTQVVVGKPTVETQFQAKGDVAGMVGMVFGQMKGTMSISFSKEAIFQIVENMLGEKNTEINASVTDAVGEMTNQIYGTAKTTLNQMGYAFEMAIPSVIQGTFTISKHHSGATLVIPFNLSNGSTFFVDITVIM
ncbi:MAG: chemotaxis protein CheX [Bdellovibrio sp. CG10_big_fil_rev_8_21_14_0_10_47_8]|nr:MAG: chemotaxis protein CheX [Bdellovibrio sp. CG10_big_fil_rev_8_21_14_0_10_47_8]